MADLHYSMSRTMALTHTPAFPGHWISFTLTDTPACPGHWLQLTLQHVQNTGSNLHSSMTRTLTDSRRCTAKPFPLPVNIVRDVMLGLTQRCLTSETVPKDLLGPSDILFADRTCAIDWSNFLPPPHPHHPRSHFCLQPQGGYCRGCPLMKSVIRVGVSVAMASGRPGVGFGH